MGRSPSYGFHDRYVNNRILECLSRPQYDASCGLTSLTCVVNFLWSQKLGIITQEQLARELGFQARSSGVEEPGNDIILKWFRKFRAKNGLRGSEDIYLDRSSFPPINSTNYENMYADIKSMVRSKNTILIHHTDYHYNIICGYFDAAEKPMEAYMENTPVKRWLLLAEQLDISDEGKEENPIDAIRLGDLKRAVKDKAYGVLRFSNKGEKLDWVPRHA